MRGFAVTVSFSVVDETSHDSSVSKPPCALHGREYRKTKKWDEVGEKRRDLRKEGGDEFSSFPPWTEAGGEVKRRES